MNEQAEKIIRYLQRFYKDEEWPTLLAQAREWAESEPLGGLKVLDGTPLFRNTLGKYAALLAAGARLYVPTNTPLPRDPAILELLPEFGIRTALKADNPFDIVLDCAGQFCRLHPTLGFAELTRSGVERYEHTLHHPIFVADDSCIKRIETTLGTGESLFRALTRLGYGDFAGRRITVVGYGKVGRGVVHYARKFGMRTIVADVEDKAAELPNDTTFVNVQDIEAFNEAVRSSWCLVTCTGRVSALKHRLRPETVLESPVLLANLGVEDEFGPAIPPSRVLNHKHAVNFMLEEPTGMRFIETTMALHNACALELLTQDLPHKCMPPGEDVQRRLLNITLRDGLIAEDVRGLGREIGLVGC